MTDLLLHHARLIDPARGIDATGHIAVTDGVIMAAGTGEPDKASINAAALSVDCGSACLAPGLVDMRVQEGKGAHDPASAAHPPQCETRTLRASGQSGCTRTRRHLRRIRWTMPRQERRAVQRAAKNPLIIRIWIIISICPLHFILDTKLIHYITPISDIQ